jgi:large subunit ribosomal protein L24
MANKVKKGDEVIVIAGDHKGSKGKILQVLREKNRVIVEGVNMIKKHEKKTQDNPQGAIIEREASLHFSNVKKAGSSNS